MKKLVFYTVVLCLFSLSCNNQNTPDDLPSCIEKSIESHIRTYSGEQSTDASVRKYEYNGQIVYIFDPGPNFADWLYQAMNEDCEVICEFGGFAGLDTCPDFHENAKFVEVVWEDK